MNLLVLYVCIIFGLFSAFSLIIVDYTFRRGYHFSRGFITICNMVISIDTCLYLNNSGWVLSKLSDCAQYALKESVGLVFIYRNEFWDYTFSLILIYSVYIFVLYLESIFHPLKGENSNTNQQNSRSKGKRFANTSSIISILCTIITTVIALVNFIFDLSK
ncbi:MAG: hypothetical protein N2484_07060 [Clostridia bacterium]|nr:hypothetical protein [Clostridia bacterium]